MPPRCAARNRCQRLIVVMGRAPVTAGLSIEAASPTWSLRPRARAPEPLSVTSSFRRAATSASERGVEAVEELSVAEREPPDRQVRLMIGRDARQHATSVPKSAPTWLVKRCPLPRPDPVAGAGGAVQRRTRAAANVSPRRARSSPQARRRRRRARGPGRREPRGPRHPRPSARARHRATCLRASGERPRAPSRLRAGSW